MGGVGGSWIFPPSSLQDGSSPPSPVKKRSEASNAFIESFALKGLKCLALITHKTTMICGATRINETNF